MLSTRQLRYFVEIAECGSFSAAAERLFIAQSALSRQIKDMETRLQTILDDPAAPLWQLVSAEEVKKLLHRETQWPWYGQLMRRPQTIAYLCQIDFWLRHYSVELVF